MREGAGLLYFDIVVLNRLIALALIVQVQETAVDSRQDRIPVHWHRPTPWVYLRTAENVNNLRQPSINFIVVKSLLVRPLPDRFRAR
jgi:hypothetical protein